MMVGVLSQETPETLSRAGAVCCTRTPIRRTFHRRLQSLSLRLKWKIEPT